jgi:thioester reductase-like protein
MGYARSKWVTENLVAIAASTRKIRAETFRIGQMVGDTVHGVWNETEAIPLQIKSAQSVGAMPELSEVSGAARLSFWKRYSSNLPSA